MPDPRFFDRAGPFRLADLAERIGAQPGPGIDAGQMLHDVAPLETAGPGDLSFIDNVRYLSALSESRAGAVLVAPKFAERLPPGVAALISARPYLAYARAAQLFYPAPTPAPGIHPSAVIDPTARLGKGVSVAAYVVIEAEAEIGDETAIGPGSVIGRRVKIGRSSRIGPQVTLSHCLVGDRVTMHPGCKIGQDGFGFAPDPAGHVKVPQLGRVLIGDHCDIGANVTIDRGSGHDTVIGAGSWIDNLVQIGHNVELGRGCIIVAQAGIAGSTKLGDFVAVGAQGGVAGHLKIGSGAQLAARTGLMHDVPAGETWGGAPGLPFKRWMRQVAWLKRVSEKKGEAE